MCKVRRVKHILIPSTVVLTAKVLAAAVQKLPTDDIAAVVDAGVTELDLRYGDPDFEPDYDGEWELIA